MKRLNKIKARIGELLNKVLNKKVKRHGKTRSAAARIEKNRRSFAVYVPSNQNVVDELLELAEIKPGETVFDIGSGDGRVVCTAAKLYGAKGVGIELNEERVQLGRKMAADMGVSHLVEIRQGDASKVKDYGKADVIFTYLGIEAMRTMKSVFEEQLRPGTRMVSNCFTYPAWEKKIVFEKGNKILYVF